jgi:uncharacterized repeat protein (TIGR03943 family)
MTPNRSQNAIKALLIIGTGLFLYSRIANGTLNYYISDRFAHYTLFAFVALLVVGLSYRFGRPRRAAQSEPHSHPDHEAHADQHSHDHNSHDQHNHNQPAHSAEQHEHHRLSWVGGFIVALPIILGVLVSPQPLGVSALDNREMNMDFSNSAMPASVRAATDKNPEEKNILDWWRSFQRSIDYSEITGQEARVIGFVYHDKRYGEGHLVLTRFIVSCCVADASVVALVVATPDAESFADNQWVEVAGIFEPSEFEAWRPPVLAAQSITPVSVPKQPYLYP